ncbi:hypothetical protein CPC08DRAFT_212461 [Agrocybe pediades]|nr:hypothetical protein CPC08DRAFT_212461 [Agrocybe pediades]
MYQIEPTRIRQGKFRTIRTKRSLNFYERSSTRTRSILALSSLRVVVFVLRLLVLVASAPLTREVASSQSQV